MEVGLNAVETIIKVNAQAIKMGKPKTLNNPMGTK